jgi:hypothetical protein
VTAHGEQNPLANHPAAFGIRTMVGAILHPSRLSWRDPEPTPPDALGLEALQRELQIQLDCVTDRLRRLRMSMANEGEL